MCDRSLVTQLTTVVGKLTANSLATPEHANAGQSQ